MTTVNAVAQIEGLIPTDYDFDKDVITDPNKIQKIIIAASNAPELKVQTNKNGDRYFMMRCKGVVDEEGYSFDDVADFILTPQDTIVYLFTGQDGSDESDWIFIGNEERERCHMDCKVRAFMDRFEYPQASFDEWLFEHQDKLSAEDQRMGQELLQTYSEYGGHL